MAAMAVGLAALVAGCIGQPAFAALTIEITGGAATQIPVAIVPFAHEAGGARSVSGVIAADLARTGQFKLVDSSGVTPPPHHAAEVHYPDWASRGADALVIGHVDPSPNGALTVTFRLLDVGSQASLASLSYTINPSLLRVTAHEIADVIYQKLTGIRGAFDTRIAYVSQQGKRFQLMVADADGYGGRPIVTSLEPIISPAWSPHGNRMAYVSFEKGHPIVYVQSLNTGRRYVLAGFRGDNSAPAWSPGGHRLAVVLSKDGNSQIYIINADGTGLKRLTRSDGIDTEPKWSPDGRFIVFTSDRGGSPQIYRIPADGGAATRLTFEGNYNVSPSFRPDGRAFAFIHRSRGAFQVAVQHLASGQMQVLTHSRLDQSPSFAPNGTMILYATELGGRGVLAEVSSDGTTNEHLIAASGDIREPAWGPFPAHH